jgi:hypothetical protein
MTKDQQELIDKIGQKIEATQTCVEYSDQDKDYVRDLVKHKGVYDFIREFEDFESDIDMQYSEHHHQLHESARLEAIEDHIDELNEAFSGDEDLSEPRDYLEMFEGFYPLVDYNYEQLLPTVGVLISFHSNYDCMNSYWLSSQEWSGDSYVADAMRALGMNVNKAISAINNEFDTEFLLTTKDLSQPYVDESVADPIEFYHEWLNSASGANLLCMKVEIDVGKLHQVWVAKGCTDEFLDDLKIVVPEGTEYGFFDDFQGGGSTFQATLKKPMTIELGESVTLDGCQYTHWSLRECGYSYREVYGEDIEGSEVEIINS